MAPSRYPMVSVEEAVGAVMDAVAPLEPERVPLVRKSVYHGTTAPALGRVLAARVVADAPHPPFAAAISDGYAFQASGQVMKLRLEDRPALCGAPFSGRPLGSMDCCYVATGAPLPNLADCVAKEEDCEVSAGQKTVVVPALAPRTDVRVPGSDWDAGDVLCDKGTVVAPADLAILAAAGHHEVAAHRLPKVVVFSTGDELWSPETGHKYDQRTMVRDANRYGLIGLLGGHGEGQAGAEVHDGGIVEDKEFALRSALREAVKHYDVVVTTGGASVGRADHAKAVLESADRGTVHFGRLHMKPGKPTTFATLDAGSFDKDEKGREKRWLFALPGNPVSALVTAQLLVVPALKRLKGFGEAAACPTEVRLALDHDLPLDGARPEYHRVSLEYRDEGDGGSDWSAAPYRFRRAAGSLAATSTGNQRSSRLLSMRGAHALACAPERGRAPLVAAGAGKALPAGTAVPGLLLGPCPPLVPESDAPFLLGGDRARKRAAVVAAEADAAGAPKVAAVAVVSGAGFAESELRAHVVTRVDAANAAAAVIARSTGLALFVRDGPPVIRADDPAEIRAQLVNRAGEAAVLVVCGGLDVGSASPPTPRALDEARKAPGLARAMALADDDPLQSPIAAIMGDTLVLVLPAPATRAARCARAVAPALPTILAQLKGRRD